MREEKKVKFEIGQKVVALTTITESGKLPGNPNADFPDEFYIHAVRGDIGKVEYVDEEDVPTVRFERTGTATIVGDDEIRYTRVSARPKTICVDFDGVIHQYVSGWKGASVITDPPVDGAFEWLRQMIDHEYDELGPAAGMPSFEVCIYSSRSKEPDAIGAMMQWLRQHGLEEDYINKLNFPTKKPPAFLVIDDRAFLFEGAFPSIEYIMNFKPWNKR